VLEKARIRGRSRPRKKKKMYPLEKGKNQEWEKKKIGREKGEQSQLNQDDTKKASKKEKKSQEKKS